MRIDIYSTPDLLVVHGKEIETVLRRAVHQAIKEHKRAGQAIAVWRNGKIEVMKSEEIRIAPITAPEQT